MAGSTWTWTGATSDPALSTNWSPAGHPQPGDTAIIPGGATAPALYSDASLSGITFELAGDGALTFSNNTTVAGTSQIDALSVIDATGTAAALSLAGPFTNLGTIEATGTQASLNIQITAGGAAPGSLNNQGQIIVGQGDTLAISGGTIFDPGAVLVNGGTATITGTLAGLGNYGIGTGGTLALGQAASLALTEITFTGTTGLLKLDAPPSFVGGINGFAPGDTIDLGPVNVSTVVFDGLGDIIAIGSGGIVFDASLPGFQHSGSFVLSGTGGLAGNLQLIEGGGADTVLTVLPQSIWLWQNGASAVAGTASDWAAVSGPGNGWGYPQPGDTAIDAGGTILASDPGFTSSTLELGGTASLAALAVTGGSATSPTNPSLDGNSLLTSNVAAAGGFAGNATPETSLLSAAGIFINDGTIAADGPVGSSFTIAIAGTTLNGSFQPGAFINYNAIQVDAGNAMTITVAGTAEFFNAGEILVNGGSLLVNAAGGAIAGGYAPASGVVVIENAGTVETNVGYAADVNGNIPVYAFAGTVAGNTLKIDTIGSFGGNILGFGLGDTIDIGTSIAVSTLSYSAGTGILKLENSGGTVIDSLLFGSGNFTGGSFSAGTGADGDTVITAAVPNDSFANSSGTWQAGSLWSNGTPGTLDTAIIGIGASNPFTVSTGASAVAAGAVVLAQDALLRITSDTTISPYAIRQYGGSLEVTSGNTLTGSQLLVDGGSTTIDATALLDLTGHPNYGTTGANDGTISASNSGTQALQVESGSLLVDGGTLDAGTGHSGGDGGRIFIGYEGGGTPATVTVQNSGTNAGSVTDSYAIVASDATSFGVLTLDGNVSWTDQIDPADTVTTRGYMLVGFNNQATISGTLTPAFSGTATLAVENGATLTEQTYATIGDSVDSAGSVVVSDALWNIGTATGGFLNVGRRGDGTLTVLRGGTVAVGGSLAFVNDGTSLIGSGINVGVSARSAGTLDIESGGTVEMLGNAAITIGRSAGATGLIIVNGPGALISEGAAAEGIAVGGAGSGTLKVSNGGTVDAGTGPIDIANQGTVVVDTGSLLQAATMTIAGTGALTIGSGATVISNFVSLQGEVLDQGGTLGPVALPAQVVIGSGADFTGAGMLGGANAEVTNSGIIDAAPAGGVTTLTVPDTVGGTGGELFIDSGATLDLAGPVGAGQTVAFNSAPGELLLGNISTFQGTIGGFARNDTIVLQGISIASSSYDAGSGTLTLFNASDASIGTLTIATTLGSGNPTVSDGVVTLACFAAGTSIATPNGQKRVEELTAGNTVRTVLGGKPRPIVWIGHRRVDCTRHPKPRQVWPVRIAAGAFGRGVPARDLYLSPDHAVYADSVLIPVKHLVNGETIAQVPCDTVTYYHIELPRHDVMLAEGLPTESFLDTGDRASFANGGRPIALHPDFSGRIREAEGCAELIVTGPRLDAVRRRLARTARRKRAA
ncbi:MAG TPA: Hint domain-containing protein [Acetobacteraceae bacterium]|nr:Hint domain-containing protein [Acetobacteraceae bacterium]